MSTSSNVRITSVAGPWPDQRGLLGWICTKNPFYALSAALFLVGLRISFIAPSDSAQAWGLMSGLAGYTLLLALTACLLVRLAAVWDDVRTVLLLMVLMFLATSVTFDEVLVLEPERGLVLYLAGLLFAVGVSEGLLWGTRLSLPLLFRLPYYLILALFFLYPLGLSLLLDDPTSEVLQWALFGFASTAAVLFLTLLPAIRKGPSYVRDNGSPWCWPLYPWALFGLLALAVPARAYLLCYSMHLVLGNNQDRLIFGLYFLLPFGLVLAVLLLEIGLVSLRLTVMRVALAIPATLVLLASVGHQNDDIYRAFLDIYTARLGADPVGVAVLLALAFYGYAALRRGPHAIDAFSLALVLLAITGTHGLDGDHRGSLWVAPILTAAGLQVVLGLLGRQAGRCVIGVGGLALVLAITVPDPWGWPAGWHALMLGALLLGAYFDDWTGRLLRALADLLVVGACAAVLRAAASEAGAMSSWVVAFYPVVLCALLVVYGLLLRHWLSHVIACQLLICWLVVVAIQVYGWLRNRVSGLDHIAVSLGLFALAVLISLAKAGLLSRWIARPGLWKPEVAGLPSPGPLEGSSCQDSSTAIQPEMGSSSSQDG